MCPTRARFDTRNIAYSAIFRGEICPTRANFVNSEFTGLVEFEAARNHLYTRRISRKSRVSDNWSVIKPSRIRLYTRRIRVKAQSAKRSRETGRSDPEICPARANFVKNSLCEFLISKITFCDFCRILKSRILNYCELEQNWCNNDAQFHQLCSTFEFPKFGNFSNW